MAQSLVGLHSAMGSSLLDVLQDIIFLEASTTPPPLSTPLHSFSIDTYKSPAHRQDFLGSRITHGYGMYIYSTCIEKYAFQQMCIILVCSLCKPVVQKQFRKTEYRAKWKHRVNCARYFKTFCESFVQSFNMNATLWNAS